MIQSTMPVNGYHEVGAPTAGVMLCIQGNTAFARRVTGFVQKMDVTLPETNFEEEIWKTMSFSI